MHNQFASARVIYVILVFIFTAQALCNKLRIVDCMLILDACENMGLYPSFRACNIALTSALEIPHVDLVRRMIIDLRSRGTGGLDQVGKGGKKGKNK